jgi:probable rRNA maturation factor
MAPDPDPARPRLKVDVCDARGLPAAAPGLARWLTGVAPASARGDVTIVLTTDARVRTLNRDYRGKDYATDVLSFPTEETDPSPQPSPRKRGEGAARTLAPERGEGRVRGMARHLGDIVIARGVATRQAREAGHALATELRILALHGLLHLLGYDHERDAGEMARVEKRLRRRGGLREGLIERAV